ncbi:MAG: preprotein translocase subunit SecE [Ruminococcus sp.]|nr:preprotein translocase subunit SecE [Ruminococcus sp.]
MAKDKEKKTSDKSQKKPNRVVKWFKDLKSEIKKVTWPCRKAVVNNTIVVLATVVVTSIFVGALDLGFYELVKFFYNH